MSCRLLLPALVAGALLAGAGCADSTDDRPVSFTYIQGAVFQQSCATAACHSGHFPIGGLGLDSVDAAYAGLVGAPCVDGEPPTDPLLNFVRPGDPQRSRLVHLLEGTDVPWRMPPDAPLPEPDIELVRNWILDGAECN